MRKKPKTTSIDDIPVEMLLLIMSYLDVVSLVTSAGMVSKGWNELANSGVLWKALVHELLTIQHQADNESEYRNFFKLNAPFLKRVKKAKEYTFYSAYKLLQEAISAGYERVVKQLIENSNDSLQKLLLTNEDYKAFWKSAMRGQLDVLKYLWDKASFFENMAYNVLVSEDYSLFGTAIYKGHHDIAKWVWEQAANFKDMQEKMLKTGSYEVFYCSAELGYLSTLKWLLNKAITLELSEEMLKAKNYLAFRNALNNSHPEVVAWLWEQAPTQQLKHEYRGLLPRYIRYLASAPEKLVSVEEILQQEPESTTRLISALEKKEYYKYAAKYSIIITRHNKPKTIYYLFYYALMQLSPEKLSSFITTVAKYQSLRVNNFAVKKVKKQLAKILPKDERSVLKKSTKNISPPFFFKSLTGTICYYHEVKSNKEIDSKEMSVNI